MLVISASRVSGLIFPFLVFLVAPSSGQRQLTPIIVLAVAFMFYISILIDINANRGTLDIFLVTNYLFFYLSSGVAVIAMELQDIKLKLDWAFPLENRILALICSILSLIIIDRVYSKKNAEYLASQMPTSTLRIATSKISIISIILSSLYFSLIPISSLFNSRASTIESLNSSFSSDSGQAGIALIVALTKIAPLCLGTYVLLVRRSRNERPKLLDLITIIPTLIAINPISSARYIFILMIITLGCTLFKLPTNATTASFMYVGVIMAILIFPNLDYSRNEKGNFKLMNLSQSLNQVANKDFDQIAMGALTLQESSNEIMPIGRQFLGEIGFWIPRKYWDSKPTDTSIIVAKATGLPNSNVSIPLWAEGWSSFRYLGLFLYPWLLSSFASRIRIRGSYNLGKRAMYYFLSGSVFILQRGPLLQATGIVAFGLITFYLLSKYESHINANGLNPKHSRFKDNLK